MEDVAEGCGAVVRLMEEDLMSILGGAMENCDSAVYNFQAGGHSDAVQQALHIRGIIEEAAGMGNALIERTRDALNAAANLIG